MITTESDAEFRVNRNRALELQKQSTSMMAAVEILEKECEDLERNDDDQSKPKLVELVQEIEDYQESIKRGICSYYFGSHSCGIISHHIL